MRGAAGRDAERTVPVGSGAVGSGMEWQGEGSTFMVPVWRGVLGLGVER